MATQVKSIAVLNAKAGKSDELRELLDGMVLPSRAEPGNLKYEIWQDHTDPDRFILDEVYADEDAVEAHRASVHYQNYRAQANSLAERTVFLLKPVI
jgi:quinol monooxygenase YgiN